jgi:hypothetical protein
VTFDLSRGRDIAHDAHAALKWAQNLHIQVARICLLLTVSKLEERE